ncbi:hypothetical protein AJ79_04759 [Helicocarpus griseus UAMH5409]|uniref:White collar 2 protein n=1 Tax=Helicocarpus griseus UAMH5409 TaxID=1447875 RepID=A0A2B7XRN3_9EURO|nr:hypothetical protein AJ79_04759 [Helicocarpus griseus UAMH5409]
MSGYEHGFAPELSGYSSEVLRDLPHANLSAITIFSAPGLGVQGPLVGEFNLVEPDRRDFGADGAQYRTTDDLASQATLLPQHMQHGIYKWEQNVLPAAGTCSLFASSPLALSPAGGGIALASESSQLQNRMHSILEGLRDLIQNLDLSGIILCVSPNCKTLVGYEPGDLLGKLIFEFIHPEERSMVVREFADSINTGNPLHCHYRFRKHDGTYLLLEAHGHVDSATDMEFSIIARPCLTKQSQLFNSFLEHKIENERLTRRIAELKREGEFELYHQNQQRDDEQLPLGPRNHYNPPYPDLHPTTPTANVFQYEFPTVLPSPAHPIPPSHPLTSPSSEEGYKLFTSAHDNTPHPISFDDSTYLDGIELMTGLHYRSGERAQGISTGDPNGTLIQGDAPPASVLAGRDERRKSNNNERRRSSKPVETHFCTDCGTFSSPEWRKGPSGKKTLCNACGLRWAKQEKKSQQAAT